LLRSECLLSELLVGSEFCRSHLFQLILVHIAKLASELHAYNNNNRKHKSFVATSHEECDIRLLFVILLVHRGALELQNAGDFLPMLFFLDLGSLVRGSANQEKRKEK